MTKKLIKFLIYLLIISILIISYLSIFGISTDKFNKRIKSEILNKNKKINLELKKVNVLLDPLNFSINIKTIAPEIIVDNNLMKLESIKTNISLKSLIENRFTIDNLQASTKAIKISDLILFFRAIKYSPELFILDRIAKGGFLIADIKLNFDKDGEIKSDYKINGFIKNAKMDIFKENDITNLNLLFKIEKNKYLLEDINGKFGQLVLSAPTISIEQKKDKFKIKGKIITDKKNIDNDILNDLFAKNFKNFYVEDIRFGSENNFSLDVSKKFKVSNVKFQSLINLDNLKYKKNFSNIKKYLPNFKNFIKLENHKVSINYHNKKLDIIGKGQIKINEESDNVDYKIIKKNNQYSFNSNIKIINNLLLLDAFQYEKKEKKDSLLSFKGIYKENKSLVFDSISLTENKNNFLIKNLILDKNFKIVDIDSLKLDYTNNSEIKNDLSIKKNKDNFKLEGKSFDLSKLIDEILDDNGTESSSIFKNLTSNIVINMKKIYIDKTTYVNDLSGEINFKNNNINKLNLFSTFPNQKQLTLTINTNANNEKITTLYSDYPKPLIKKYKFIKGFEEGVLDFYSIKKGNFSNSLLKIDNFKVQEVPVLAKLLTLASLQGIADLLTGEGIRFTDLEMKFSNENNLTTIDEMYAIGPAISILLDGYIESKKIVSLRGTLVPATTINKTIASIPLLGDILVGKKVGEGIFGVSFKLKGPPKDIKTTVNPIKTLTPRFITRTLEKIKKN